MKVVTTCLQSLLGCGEKGTSATHISARHTVARRAIAWMGMKLKITAGRLNRRAIEAVYSALSTSQSVAWVFISTWVLREEHTVETEDDRRHCWHWIAYAFFSHYATQNIRQLTIASHDIRLQDMEYVEQLLQHPDPLALLTGHGEVTPASTATTPAETATASLFRLSQPSSDPASTYEPGLRLSRQQIRILPCSSADSDDGYESVLLPGYGRAWVQQSDIEDRSLSSTDSHRCLERLAVYSMKHEILAAVLTLLKLVGHRLKTLHVGGNYNEVLENQGLTVDAWLLDVIAWCAKLERFKVSCLCLKSLDVLARAFEGGQGSVASTG